MRIKGQFGPWPVDLQIELDELEWARLGAALGARSPAPAMEPASAPAVAAPARAEDRLWHTACELLRQAGAVDGPQLLAELQALAGSAEAGKRLLVRLRHSPQVRLEALESAPRYLWIGDQ